MNKQKKIILGVIFVAILLMSVGYAGLTSTNLTIEGSASATAVQDNFKVYFTGANTVISPDSDTDTITIDASATNGAIKADVDISGLTKKGDSAYAILEIENGSNDVNASSVDVTASAEGDDIIAVDAKMCNASGGEISNYAVASGSKTYVKVSATLLQTPVEDASVDIDVSITAKPEGIE